MRGQVGILNVGAGDTKLTFNQDDPAECIRAARIVTDMLRRGYALLVDTGKKDDKGRPVYQRAKQFDEATREYIIADFDPVEAEKADAAEGPKDEPPATPTDGAPRAKRGRPLGTWRLPAAETHAVAVARSAGG